MGLNVLIACEESQRVTQAFRDNGIEAYSCDIIPTSGNHPEWHILTDVRNILNGDCVCPMEEGENLFKIGVWDAIIAFPPCTYLSNAAACRLYPRKGELDLERYKKGLEAKKFFLDILFADSPHIAVENPVSSRIFEMPPCTQEIQPYYFGYPVKKKTRLWLVNLPKLIPTDLVEPIGTYIPSGTGRKTNNSAGLAKRGDDSKERSKTFHCIAEAMANQWGDYLKKEYEL